MKSNSFSLKAWIDRGLRPLTRAFVRVGISPNAVTVAGVLVSFLVPYAFLKDQWFAAALWLFASGFFDVLDGSMARNEKRGTAFGAFWDSTLDRLGEAVIFAGFILYYGRHQDEIGVLLALSVLVLSFLVSYTRARAEGLGIDCEVGVLPRPGRILLLIAGLLFHQLTPILWVVGVLSLVTVGQRVHRVWMTLKKTKAKKRLISHR